MSHTALEPGGLTSGVVLVICGLYAIWRSGTVARRNQDYIDSGRETYFEERRAWKFYGAPPTDPERVKRLGWYCLAGGLAVLLLNSPISIFHWS